MMNRDLEMARRLAASVQEAGGRAYFVGGYVRDAVLHRENKDIDIEIHGLTPARLESILDSLGERTVMGASFGVYGLKHYDLDIAMPRSETKTGRGHRDFTVDVDPFLGTKKAAQRRDFTVNALMQDVLTLEIVDHFGGLEDLRQGVIRHVNDDTFIEDPLRVLRAAQFAARFGFSIAPETMSLCAGMDLTALASERIMEEMCKALLKARRPSVFFDILREMNQLHDWFPEVLSLIGVEQEAQFHPEGDVYTHTMLVLDQAAALRGRAVYPLGLMLSALCHDFGKVQATSVIDGRIRALGHENLGVPAAQAFICRLSSEVRLKKYVLNMVKLHMRPNALCYMHSGHYAYMKLLDESVEPSDLLLLARADHCGRTGHENDYDELEKTLSDALRRYQALMQQPFVRGEDLIRAGMKPGKAMGEALAFAHRQRLRGVPKDQALRNTLAAAHQAAQDEC
ncbi:MAG: tRNA nucleotidyltransferase [Clostridia bacterium]|nr:tRNA nucleotidyltransferase [Clostridia bacterium]